LTEIEPVKLSKEDLEQVQVKAIRKSSKKNNDQTPVKRAPTVERDQDD
jgi:hypothetical protein